MTVRPVAAAAAFAILALAPAACQARETTMPPPVETLDVRAVAGLWRLDDGTGPCRLALQPDPMTDGARAARAEGCTGRPAEQAAWWRLAQGGFEVLDQAGRVILHFRRTGEDEFVSTEGDLRLSRAPEA